MGLGLSGLLPIHARRVSLGSEREGKGREGGKGGEEGRGGREGRKGGETHG